MNNDLNAVKYFTTACVVTMQ